MDQSLLFCYIFPSNAVIYNHENSIVFATVNMQKDFSCGSFILLYDFVIELYGLEFCQFMN